MGHSLFFALRLVFSFRKKFFASQRIVAAILVIIFSLIPLVVAQVVVDGMIVGISDRFISLGDGHIKIQTYKAATLEQIDTIEAIAYEFPWVVSVTRSLDSKGLLISPTTFKKSGVAIKAFNADFLTTNSSYKKYIEIIDGSCATLGEKEILVSVAVAKSLDIKVGDEVDILMIATLAGKDVPIKGRYTVRALFQTGYYQLDNFCVYMNFKRVYPLFKEQGVSLYITTDNPYHDINLRTQELRSNVVTKGNWSVSSWQTNNKTLFQTLQETRFLIYVILVGILIITSFNILSTFFMIIKEKEQNIAILKSCGVSNRSIVFSFVLSGLIIAFIGTTLGIGLGLLVGNYINQIISFIETLTNYSLISSDYYLEKIPISINWITIFLFYMLSISLAFIFTLLPSLRITKIKVIDIIRRH